MINLSNNKKRFALVATLALTFALLLVFPAMPAERTTLNIISPVIGENQINQVPLGTDVTFVSAVPDTPGAMYTFWIGGPDGWSLVQESASDEYTLNNVQHGTYTVDVYIWNASNRALAEARQVILVESCVTFTEFYYKDGKITLTAQAENISGVPEYQFWYKDSEGWKCVQDYSALNTASFDAVAGETYEIAVYAKDENAIRDWKQAASASDRITAIERIEANEGNSGDVLNLQVGQILKLTLDENPSTGFTWEYGSVFDANVLEQVASWVQHPETPEGWVGASVKRNWIYRALNTGSTTIDLQSVRPWSTSPVPVDTFTLEVNVQA